MDNKKLIDYYKSQCIFFQNSGKYETEILNNLKLLIKYLENGQIQAIEQALKEKNHG